jgi:ATPase family associated with various cellular activities (AAA)
LKLADYVVVGNCVCVNPDSRSYLRWIAERIAVGLKKKTLVAENFLIWGSSGSGKSFLVKQIAADMGGTITFVDVDFSSVTLDELKAKVAAVNNADKPVLVLFDEVDSRETEAWIYTEVFRLLEINFNDPVKQAVFVLVGSGGGSKYGLMKRIRETEAGAKRDRGDDLINRIENDNQVELPDLILDDRIAVLASQIVSIAREQANLTIVEIEKLAIYCLLSNQELTRPRHYELAIRRALARLSDPDSSQFRFEDLFDRYDPNVRVFWEVNGIVATRLQHRYMRIRS